MTIKLEDDEDSNRKLHLRKDMVVVRCISRSRLLCWGNNEIVLWELKTMKEQPPGELNRKHPDINLDEEPPEEEEEEGHFLESSQTSRRYSIAGS